MKRFIIAVLVALGFVAMPMALAFAQTGSTSTSCVTLTRNLSVGAHGSDIVALQTFLQNAGYLQSTPTGYFGLQTAAAVRAFQSTHNISPVSGYVGALTRAAIKANGCTNQTVKTNDTVDGCPAGAMFNYLTGALCPTTATTTVPTITRISAPAANDSEIYAGEKFAIEGTNFSVPDSVLAGGYPATVIQDASVIYAVASPNLTTGTGYVIVSNKNGSSTPFSVKTYATTSVIPSCTITTDKTAYTFGDTIHLSWTSQNANYGAWRQDTSGKDDLVFPGDKLGTSGTQTVTASVIGNPIITLDVFSTTTASSCTKAISISAATSTPHSPDINGDGKVDFNDFLIMQNTYNKKVGDAGYDARADLNGDGKVDFNDYLILQNAMNSTSTQQTPNWSFISSSASAGPTNANGSTSFLTATFNIQAKPMGSSMLAPAAGDISSVVVINGLTYQIPVSSTTIAVTPTPTNGVLNENTNYVIQYTVLVPGSMFTTSGSAVFKITQLAANMKGVPTIVQTTGLDSYQTQPVQFNAGPLPIINSFTVTPSTFNPKYQNLYDVAYTITGATQSSGVNVTAECHTGLTIQKMDDGGNLSPFNCGDLAPGANGGFPYGVLGGYWLVFTNSTSQSINESLGLNIYNVNSVFRTITIPPASSQAQTANILPQKSTDINGDGRTDFNDFMILQNTFNKKEGDTGYDSRADLNSDGKVDLTDYNILSAAISAASATTTGAVKGASVAASCTVITQALQRGTNDAYAQGEVTLLQNFLETQGFSFSDKGTFGPVTESALESWQTSHGISPTGVTGPLTRQAISDASCH